MSATTTADAQVATDLAVATSNSGPALSAKAERDPAVARTARQLRLLGRQLIEGMEDDQQHEH